MAEMEMVERVARAIYKGRNGHGCAPWSHLTGSHRQPYKDDARAAIKAMREPTDAMVDAANNKVRPDSDNLQCPDWYSAAIDAALSDTRDKG